MSRIFLSHSSRDNFEAMAMRDWLASEGWDDVFLDLDAERGIAAGERWERALHAAAMRCEAVIFLVSANWLASGWCLKEHYLARSLNKKLFALLIDPEKKIGDLPPELIGTWQVISLAGGQDMQLFRIPLPGSHEEKHVGYSRDGLRRLKRGLEKAGLDPKFFPWPPDKDPDRAPYRGLKPLEAVDAGIFFGRDAPIVEAADRLRGMHAGAPPRLLVILGASGAGKSSFLRAGLLPRLSRDDAHFLPLPAIRPERAALTGDTGLLGALEATFPASTRAELRAAIRMGPAGLRPLLAAHVAKAVSQRPQREAMAKQPAIVLAIDQAEELFRGDDATEGTLLLDLVRELTIADDPSVIVIFAIRSDAYDALQQTRLLAGLRQETLPLLPMPRGAYMEVIAGPARRATEAGGKLAIEPQLTQRLLEDIEKGGGSDALPLLAFTLEQLYLEYGRAGVLKLADYQQFGGLKGAIDAAVERAFARADADIRIPRDRSEREKLLRLGFIPWLAGIDPDSNNPRRNIARRSEIPREAVPLIELLVEERLLSTDMDPTMGEKDERIATVEPAHEALLRQWGLLQGWLAEDSELLVTLGRVRRTAREWDANRRNDDWLHHRGQLMEQARALLSRADMASKLDSVDKAYLDACVERFGERARPELSLSEKIQSVIALARLGAAAVAQRRFDELGLDKVIASGQSRVDISALKARLAKVRALATDNAAERAELMNRAADMYDAVFQLTGSDYPLLNVAAFRLWTGDKQRSRQAAQSALGLLLEKPAGEHDYWHFVALAEAHLLTGDLDRAGREIETAASYERKQDIIRWDAFASTSRQLRRSCRLLGLSEDFLAPLRVPPVIVYTGNRPGPRLTATREPDVAAAIKEKLAAEASHIGIGGLAAGADILFAEALLARGADLHVVLAFPTEMFIDHAVAPYGDDWVERFHACLNHSRTVKQATTYGYIWANRLRSAMPAGSRWGRPSCGRDHSIRKLSCLLSAIQTYNRPREISIRATMSPSGWPPAGAPSTSGWMGASRRQERRTFPLPSLPNRAPAQMPRHSSGICTASAGCRNHRCPNMPSAFSEALAGSSTNMGRIFCRATAGETPSSRSSIASRWRRTARSIYRIC
jgi:TIR domain